MTTFHHVSVITHGRPVPYVEASDPETAKEALIEHYRHVNVTDGWDRFILDGFREDLETMGFSNIEFRWSGFWCQGDGLSFTADVDVAQFIRSQKLGNKLRKLLNLAKRDQVDATISRRCHQYAHEHTVSANVELLDDPWYEEMTKDLTEGGQIPLYQVSMEKIWAWYDARPDTGSGLEGLLNEVVQRMCREFYAILRSNYEEATTDEAVWATIEANDLHESAYIVN